MPSCLLAAAIQRSFQNGLMDNLSLVCAQVPYGSSFHSHLQWDAISVGEKQTRLRVSCEVRMGLYRLLACLPTKCTCASQYVSQNHESPVQWGGKVLVDARTMFPLYPALHMPL